MADVQELKIALRAEAKRRRLAESTPAASSARIVAQLLACPEYAAAKTVLWYVDVRDEVRTNAALPQAIADKRVAVPYCEAGLLRLFLLQGVDELERGAYGIREPAVALRKLPGRRIGIEEIDLAVLPGLAFDRRGGRLGYGKGYYDKLLATALPCPFLVGLAYDSQLFPEVPMSEHDIRLHAVATESELYRC
ncbi:5-formyltetrahydrofolate cyclo-ligase [Lignipirellula cremea]|uniref:5-formyltetrahydrofolate cyclo-ligase n=1 Tax=Lignipirellula cremea TaxID=2528010 RepID=A0A518E2L4_9BACT|nr:5-formyltetrahydrofolate cyclo-ligase [Lignipirellula cremea]QDU98331.1 5-formyltetrahydrofolate cyclo-ligase family protein [Lignipirellula cremea]